MWRLHFILVLFHIWLRELKKCNFFPLPLLWMLHSYLIRLHMSGQKCSNCVVKLSTNSFFSRVYFNRQFKCILLNCFLIRYVCNKTDGVMRRDFTTNKNNYLKIVCMPILISFVSIVSIVHTPFVLPTNKFMNQSWIWCNDLWIKCKFSNS